jgi:pyruvate dehydrogenase E1 component alpha subunit/2-oxoisovalerate dehydrogenase E1 component alpha subunit
VAQPAKARRGRARPGKAQPEAAPPRSEPRPTDEPVRLVAPDGRWIGPKGGSGLTPKFLLSLFRGMLKVRVVDGRMLKLQRQGRIGFYGQCTGQEAAIIGSAAALTPQDWVAPALREAGVAMWRGLPLERMVGQCMGKGMGKGMGEGAGSTFDPSQGRQMPCHHTFRAGHFLSMSSVIATQLVHATGLAIAARIRKDPVVAIGYLGDGATSEPDFHSALNFAAVMKAPVVFFCQNNQWAISVPVTRQTASRTLAIKAVAYGMPGVRVDGNDVLAVHAETKKAVERARAGGGPTLIEALTYRRMGHSSSDDPTRYRDDAEVKKWEQLDPLDRFRRHLTALGLLTSQKATEIEDQLEVEISEAIRLAEQHPEPQPESLVTDVFATPTPQLLEQRDLLLASLARSSGAPRGHAPEGH